MKDKFAKIFDHDLLDDPELYNIFIGLINPDVTKPFECVGTRAEINFSLSLGIEKDTVNEDPLPKLLEWYRDNLYRPSNTQDGVAGYYNPKHFIPEQFLPLILNS
jgi:hypothetical protein